jgi:hypothetical protein
LKEKYSSRDILSGIEQILLAGQNLGGPAGATEYDVKSTQPTNTRKTN